MDLEWNAFESLFAVGIWVSDTAKFNVLYLVFNAFYNAQEIHECYIFSRY